MARSIGLLVAGTRVMRMSAPDWEKTCLRPRQWATWSWREGIPRDGPIVTESKPRRPWQNTRGSLGARRWWLVAGMRRGSEEDVVKRRRASREERWFGGGIL